MDMHFIDYRPEHFLLMDIQDTQRHVLEEAVSPKDYAEYIFYNTLAPKSIIIENEVVAIIAINPMSSDAGEVTSLLSRKIKTTNKMRYYYHGFRKARQYVDNMLLYRLEARVVSGDEEQVKLVKFLGFDYEATLEGAGHNRTDVDIYKRIRKDEYI